MHRRYRQIVRHERALALAALAGTPLLAGLAIGGLTAAVEAPASAGTPHASSSSGPSEIGPATGDGAPSIPALERQKLEAELEQLRLENERAGSPISLLADIAPSLAFIIGAGGLAGTWWKNAIDARKERVDALRIESETLQARFSELFGFATANLASDDPRLQAAGAASLTRLQQLGEPEFQRTVAVFLAARLRLGLDDLIRPTLLSSLGDALRGIAAGTGTTAVDLSGACLAAIDLTSCNVSRATQSLEGADLTSAILREANFRGVKAADITLDRAVCIKANFGNADLSGARAHGAVFDGARLVGADLRSAILDKTSLKGAELQSALFKGAVFTDVDFSYADLRDTHLEGASMDDATRASLERAKNIGEAHL